VERGFSSLKNPDVIGLTPGLSRMRGLVKMSILVACMWVAHNLHLRMVDEERQAKWLPRVPRASRRRRKAKPEKAPLVAVGASAPRWDLTGYRVAASPPARRLGQGQGHGCPADSYPGRRHGGAAAPLPRRPASRGRSGTGWASTARDIAPTSGLS